MTNTGRFPRYSAVGTQKKFWIITSRSRSYRKEEILTSSPATSSGHRIRFAVSFRGFSNSSLSWYRAGANPPTYPVTIKAKRHVFMNANYFFHAGHIKGSLISFVEWGRHQIHEDEDDWWGSDHRCLAVPPVRCEVVLKTGKLCLTLK